MYTVEVNSGFEKVGVAGKAHRGKESSVRAAPQPDPLWIDIWQAFKVVLAGDHVVVFRSSTPACVWRLTKIMTVHDAEAVIDR